MSYVSTKTLCEHYEVDKDFFLRRKSSGEYKKNFHYVQQGNTLRWDFDKIKAWWRGEDTNIHIVNSVLNKVMIEV